MVLSVPCGHLCCNKVGQHCGFLVCYFSFAGSDSRRVQTLCTPNITYQIKTPLLHSTCAAATCPVDQVTWHLTSGFSFGVQCNSRCKSLSDTPSFDNRLKGDIFLNEQRGASISISHWNGCHFGNVKRICLSCASSLSTVMNMMLMQVANLERY